MYGKSYWPGDVVANAHQKYPRIPRIVISNEAGVDEYEHPIRLITFMTVNGKLEQEVHGLTSVSCVSYHKRLKYD
jgi:hypothetical protein